MQNTLTPNMQTFRARNVMAALEEVQRVLGPDAIVVSVRQATPPGLLQAWQEPKVEVMAMPANKISAPKAPVEKAAAPEPEPPAGETAEDALANAREADSKNAPRAGSKRFPIIPPGLLALQDRLSGQSLDPQLVKKLITGCLEVLPPRLLKDDAYLKQHISMQLQVLLHVRPEQQSGREVICLVGASGSGKTNLCAKIAASSLKSSERKIAWVCADTVTTGAISQARQYTSALQIPLHTPYTPSELADTVAGLEEDLVLVDLQSFNPYVEKSIMQFADYLTVLPHKKTLWVLSAAGKDMDLNRAYQVLKPFRIDGLAVSHVDETGSFGGAFNVAWRSRIPLTYFSTGSRVPEDLHPARRETLVQAILEEQWPTA